MGYIKRQTLKVMRTEHRVTIASSSIVEFVKIDMAKVPDHARLKNWEQTENGSLRLVFEEEQVEDAEA